MQLSTGVVAAFAARGRARTGRGPVFPSFFSRLAEGFPAARTHGRISCRVDFLLGELAAGIPTAWNSYCKDLAVGFPAAKISR